MELIPRQENSITAPNEPTLEEMRENLLLGIKMLVRQASGIHDEKEYQLLYGRAERELKLVLDHIIILASH